MLRRVPLLIALVFGGCATSQTKSEVAAAPTRTERALPSVELVTLDGKSTQLASALAGRPALVSLWATWCEACATEFEPLQRLSERAPSLGAAIVAVAVGEPRDKVADFVKSHQLGYDQLVDEQFRFADGMGERRVPTTLVVDRQGRVVYSGGILDEAALAALERVITQPVAAR